MSIPVPIQRYWKLARCHVDAKTGVVSDSETTSRLSPRELHLFRYLAIHQGQALSRGALQREVFGFHPDAETRVVDATIRRLRIRLRDGAAPQQHIRTVHGVGYRFVAQNVASRSQPATVRLRRVEQVLDALERHRVVSLFGEPGVGKSAVAREVARVASGPVVWIDCGAVLDDWQHAELVICDGGGQVSVPSALVTSSARLLTTSVLPWKGAHHAIHLPHLDSAEALDLLRDQLQEVPLDELVAHDLLTQTTGNAALLVWAGGVLAERGVSPGWASVQASLPTRARELAGPRVAEMADAISPRHWALMQASSLLEGRFDVEQVAHMLSRPPSGPGHAVATELEELVDLALLRRHRLGFSMGRPLRDAVRATVRSELRNLWFGRRVEALPDAVATLAQPLWPAVSSPQLSTDDLCALVRWASEAGHDLQCAKAACAVAPTLLAQRKLELMHEILWRAIPGAPEPYLTILRLHVARRLATLHAFADAQDALARVEQEMEPHPMFAVHVAVLRLGLQARQGAAAHCMATARCAVELAEAIGSRAIAAQVWRTLAGVLLREGATEGGREALIRAASVGDEPRANLDARLWLARLDLNAGDGEACAHHLACARDLGVPSDVDASITYLVYLAELRTGQWRDLEAESLYREAIRRAQASEVHVLTLNTLAYAALQLSLLDAHDLADQLRSIILTRRQPSDGAPAAILEARVAASRAIGDLRLDRPSGYEALEDAITSIRRLGLGAHLSNLVPWLALAAGLRNGTTMGLALLTPCVPYSPRQAVLIRSVEQRLVGVTPPAAGWAERRALTMWAEPSQR